uniref:Putative secreted protein n=1 Tax=Anopheles marajoara TaxID=58244 RepID=A0A2M4CBD4_9DIPT
MWNGVYLLLSFASCQLPPRSALFWWLPRLQSSQERANVKGVGSNFGVERRRNGSAIIMDYYQLPSRSIQKSQERLNYFGVA